ncbi:hypothetical protein ACUODJ_56025, partial [Escherichia sp. HC-CC]
MRKFIFVLLTLLLVSPFSFAMKGIIWQPQNRDSQVTDTQWQGLMSQQYENELTHLPVHSNGEKRVVALSV